MKLNKRILSSVMALMILITSLPLHVFADTTDTEENTEGEGTTEGEDTAETPEDPYTIKNKYMTYTINPNTGGFSVVTAEGHPQKSADNNIPLLYQDDIEKSIETSYVTVRIDGEDYIFGRKYDFYDIKTTLSKPVKSDLGRQISITWTLGDIEVTQMAAISYDEEESTTGNIAIKYAIVNKGTTPHDVGLRVLFDTALGKEIDAPYFFSDDDVNPMLHEISLEKSEDEIPDQLRLSNIMSGRLNSTHTAMTGYFLFDDRTFDFGDALKPDKITIGHWAHLANTRYEYEPNKYSSFMSIVGNDELTGDSSVALYWDEEELAPSGTKNAEILYGVGSFTESSDSNKLGINIIVQDSVVLGDDGEYINDGNFTVTVELNNTFAYNQLLKNINITAQIPEGIDAQNPNDSDEVPKDDGSKDDEDEDEDEDDEEQEMIKVMQIGISQMLYNDIQRREFEMTAEEVEMLTAKPIIFRVQADIMSGDTISGRISTTDTKYILLPGTSKKKPLVAMDKILPEIVYHEGYKYLMVHGDMTGLKGLLGTEKWDLFLVHETTGKKVRIAKNSIAFIDEAMTSMSINTEEKLELGKHYLEFSLYDEDYKELYGDTIRSAATFESSDDIKYKSRFYTMMVIVKTTGSKDIEGLEDGEDAEDATAYKHSVLTFYSEEELNEFIQHKIDNDTYPERVDVLGNKVKTSELYITLRGNFRETGEGTNIFTARTSEGPVTINNIVRYTEDTNPLILKVTTGTIDLGADGGLTVINALPFWAETEWDIVLQNDEDYSMNWDEVKPSVATKKPLQFSADKPEYAVNNVMGWSFDIVTGILVKEKGVEERLIAGRKDYVGKDIYGITFGGKLQIPMAVTEYGKKDTESDGKQEKKKDPVYDQDTLEGTYEDGKITLTIEEEGRKTFEGVGVKTAKGTILSNDLFYINAEDVRYGQHLDDPEELGFVGIDITTKLGLPPSTFGQLAEGSGFGFTAEVVINSIDNIYSVKTSLDIIKLFAGFIDVTFKSVVNKEDVYKVYPDNILIGYENRAIDPTALATFGTVELLGMNGGFKDIADSYDKEYLEKVPDTSFNIGFILALFQAMRLEIKGEIAANRVIVEGTLTEKWNELELVVDLGDILEGEDPTSSKVVGKLINGTVSLGINWADGIKFTMNSEADILSIVKGALKITITDDYWYGYAKVEVVVPVQIPVIGGASFAGGDFGISSDFIGGNIKFCDIGVGIKYTWSSGDVDFNLTGGVSLTPPPGVEVTDARLGEGIWLKDESGNDVYAVFGTNVVELASVGDDINLLNLAMTMKSEQTKELRWTNTPDNIMFTVPIKYSGDISDLEPTSIKVTKADNTTLALTEAATDGSGTGNFLIQEMPDGSLYMHFSKKDAIDADKGIWTVKSNVVGLTLGTIEALEVKNVAEISSVSYTYDAVNSPFEVPLTWTATEEAPKESKISVFLTEEMDYDKAIESVQNGDDNSYLAMVYDLEEGETGGNFTVELPENLKNGTYRVVASYLSGAGGINYVWDDTSFVFTNPNLPKGIDAASLIYAGNGRMFLNIADESKDDYTNYEVSIFRKEDNGTLTDVSDVARGYFYKDYPTYTTDYYSDVIGPDKGLQFEIIPIGELETEREYIAKIRTVNKKINADGTTTNFRADESDIYTTESFMLPKANKPKLLEVKIDEANREAILNGKPLTEDFLVINYVFDDNVAFKGTFNGNEYDSTTYTKEAQVKYPLTDGDLIVSFEAYNFDGDFITSSDFPDILGASLAVKVDNTAPLLGLTQEEMMTYDDEENEISMYATKNVFYADTNGNYTIKGLTEPGVVLSGNGKVYTDADINANGVFEVNSSLDGDIAMESIDLTATDSAGNTSTIAVSVIRKDFTDIETLKIYQKNMNEDGTFSLKSIEDDGIEELNRRNYIEVPFGTDIEFVVKGVTEDDVEMTIPEHMLAWDAVYDINLVEFDGNKFITKNVGEVALVARLMEGMSLASTGEITRYAKEDYVIINITETDKSALKEAIDAAERELFNDGNATASETRAFKALVEEAKALYDDFYADVDDVIAITEKLLEATAAYIEAKNRAGSSGGSSGQGGITNPFTDVSPLNWFYEAVMSMLEKEIMRGTSETTFSPYITSSRAMLVVMLHRLAGELNVDSSVEFTDVLADMWYSEAVDWIVSEGIMLGYGDGIFGINDDITREQLVTILWRFSDEPVLEEQPDMSKFIDFSEVSNYAVEAMKWAYSIGLVQGRSATELAPKGNANRAEIATIFDRFVVKYIEKYME